jgi:hypothetical protein
MLTRPKKREERLTAPASLSFVPLRVYTRIQLRTRHIMHYYLGRSTQMLPQSKRSPTGVLYQLPGHWRRCHAVEEGVKDFWPARLANHQALPTHREGASAALWGLYETVPLGHSDLCGLVPKVWDLEGGQGTPRTMSPNFSTVGGCSTMND